MENSKLEELHALYISLIPLLQKCNTRENIDRSDKLGNKNQVMAIMIIGKAETISMTFLSKFINMEKGSLTTLIDSLEKMDYVKRLDDPNDRRKKMLSLTAEGIIQLRVIEEQSKKSFADMIVKLNESEIDEMFTSLKSLVKILRKIN